MKPVYIDPNNIKGIECKHVCYQAATDGSMEDLLLIKEVVHTKDNKLIPRLKQIRNFQRDFYITKPNKRNHQQKKEAEHLDNLLKYSCTQVELSQKIQLALGQRFADSSRKLRDVCTNPYVYYADITTPTIIKQKYQERWPDMVSNNKVAILDIETDVLGPDKDVPVMISVTCGQEKLVGILESYANRIPDCSNKISTLYADLMSKVNIKNKDGEYVERNLVEERGKTIKFFYDKNPGALFQRIMLEVHKMMPDFVAIWNMNFDLPKLIAMLDREKINAADVFCDPSVPEEFRYAKYREAKAIRETNSKTISQHPADLWHVMQCMSGFYWIDAMCLFKKIRVANGNEASYSLDYILKKHLGIGKLKFDGVEGEGSLRWHINMQRDYPAEYVVYNIFDCVSIELLDEKTKDLESTVSALADISELSIFPSLPRRLVDILTYFYFENNMVPGTAGSQVKSELDEIIIGLTDWIVTLPAYMVMDDGLFCLEECPEIRTKFRTQTADDDLTQAYPTGGLVMNISKETTSIELCSIDGVSEQARRRAGINLTGGMTNAIEVCNDILGLPYIHDVLDVFNQDIASGVIKDVISEPSDC